MNFDVFIAMEALIYQKVDFVEQLVLDPGRTAFSANDARQKTSSLLPPNSALEIRHLGRVDWTRCSPTKEEDNGSPAFLQPQELG